MPGIHKLIGEIRPPRMPVIMITSGSSPNTIDDLMGAGYVNRVVFRFEDVPTADQWKSVRAAEHDDVDFAISVVLNPNKLDIDDILKIAELSEGHQEFILLTSVPPRPTFRKRDLNALAKALKGRARGVRVLEDIRNL